MPEDLVRVGRCMSREEYALMVKTGQVQESASGTTHAAFPADRAAFQSQALRGSLYVEFDIPQSTLRPTRQGWVKILGPNSLEGRQARKVRTAIPQMPASLNIRHEATKMSTIQTNQLQKMEFEIVQALDGSSLHIDIILSTFLARATIGSISEGGYCDTEIIDYDDGRIIHSQHCEFTTSLELNAVLIGFFQKLRDLPTQASTPTVSFDLPLSDKNIRLDDLLGPLLTAAGR